MDSLIVVTFLLFLKLNFTNANSKFLKIETCETSNISMTIEKCEIIEGKFNLIFDVFEPINHLQVMTKECYNKY